MNECQELKLDQIGKYLEHQAYIDKIPLKGTFELSARCNFNCNMCYVHLSEDQIKNIGRELTNEEWLEIARQARDAGMLYLTLTGGEVFARLPKQAPYRRPQRVVRGIHQNKVQRALLQHQSAS